MPDISISASSPVEMALEEAASGNEFVADTAGTVLSGRNAESADSNEQTMTGTEMTSRTSEYMGAGPDWTSTGTDVDIQKAVENTLNDGMGSIADKIA